MGAPSCLNQREGQARKLQKLVCLPLAPSPRHSVESGVEKWLKGRQCSAPVISKDQLNNEPNLGRAPFPPPPGGPILELLICFHSSLNKLNLLIKVVK